MQYERHSLPKRLQPFLFQLQIYGRKHCWRYFTRVSFSFARCEASRKVNSLVSMIYSLNVSAIVSPSVYRDHSSELPAMPTKCHRTTPLDALPVERLPFASFGLTSLQVTAAHTSVST